VGNLWKKIKFSREDVFAYIWLTFGALLVALSFDLFLIPNRVVAGGISGVAIILHYMLQWQVGLTMLIINVFLFVVSFRVVGGPFGIKTIYTTIVLAIFIDTLPMLTFISPLTDELLMASLFGGILCGLGLAIVFNQDASSGGTDILARVVNKYTGMEMGKALLVFDFIIAAGSGIILASMDTALYSLLTVLVTTYGVDAFIGMFNNKTSVLIISSKADEIVQRILHDLDRGATILHGTGPYSGKKLDLVLTIVNRKQMVKVRNIVRDLDRDGFVVIGRVSEVLGHGFRKNVA